MTVTGDVFWTSIFAVANLGLSAENMALESIPENVDTLNNVSNKYEENESGSEKNKK